MLETSEKTGVLNSIPKTCLIEYYIK